MTLGNQFIAELKQQAANSKKVLERIPTNNLTWKPHEKSTPIGRLGMHIAELPRSIAMTLETEGLDFAALPFKPVFPGTTAEIMETFDKSLAKAVEALEKATDQQMAVTWTARRGDQIIVQAPRSTVIRDRLYHIVHHRGQLTVYLRLLNIPVPKTFGPTADEK